MGFLPEIGFALDSPLEEDGFELAVPPRTESLWAATPGKHCRFGPEPVSGSAFRAAVSDWQRPEEPFARAGPMVRIRFPPAASLSHRCLRWQQAQKPGVRRECEPGRDQRTGRAGQGRLALAAFL